MTKNIFFAVPPLAILQKHVIFAPILWIIPSGKVPDGLNFRVRQQFDSRIRFSLTKSLKGEMWIGCLHVPTGMPGEDNQ